MHRFLRAILPVLLIGLTWHLHASPHNDSAEISLNSDVFCNIQSQAGEESAIVVWSINCATREYLKAHNTDLIIAYRTKIGENRNGKGIDGNKWLFTKSFSPDSNRFELTSLLGGEHYSFKIGFALSGKTIDLKKDNDQMVWSEEIDCVTESGWGIFEFLILIGSLGFFIYGMKVMSEGLQQASGKRLRSMLSQITSNRIKGVLTGFGSTAIVQSSSVTTVMTVSFVNAGLMSLRQSAGVMMGANIGTTITGWLILLMGFQMDISEYTYIIIAFAIPLLFISKGKSRAWASAIFGFCILFMGLEALKNSVPTLDENSALVQFFLTYQDAWYGTIMFVILGALITIVIQSSSAAMALTLAMVHTGTIPFEVACGMVLGENIGTTITAELAGLVANVHAKRSARIHSMFNIIGVGWMLLVLPFFLKGLSYLVGGDPYKDVEVANTTIVLFHSAFNTVNVFFMIWFVPQLCRLAELTVKSRGESDEVFKLDFIGGPLGSTAELCILEAKKEVAKFGSITSRMNKFIGNYLNTADQKVKGKMLEKIEKYEDITDRVEIEIADFLSKTARLEMSAEASITMRGMLNISTDLERIGDIFYQMSRSLERKDRNKIFFTPEQRMGLNEMLKLVSEAFEIMNHNLNSQYGAINLNPAMAKELEINGKRDELRENMLIDIGSGSHTDNALIFSDMFSSLEKVGDHIINVSEHVANRSAY